MPGVELPLPDGTRTVIEWAVQGPDSVRLSYGTNERDARKDAAAHGWALFSRMIHTEPWAEMNVNP